MKKRQKEKDSTNHDKVPCQSRQLDFNIKLQKNQVLEVERE